MKSQLLERVSGLLEGANFAVSDCGGSRSCFDFIARKGRTLLLVKVLSNIEGLTANTVHELRKASFLTGGVPFVVGERLKSSELMDGVLYERYGMRALNVQTLKAVLSDSMPFTHSIRGNYCVNIDSGMLKSLRGRLDLTQEELARELGVSKQSVYRYEASGSVLFDVMERMLRIFGDDRLLLHENPLKTGRASEDQSYNMHVTDMKRVVARKLSDMGFSTSIVNAPFDVVARKRETVFAVVSNDQRRLENKIRLVREVTGMVGGYGLCVTDRQVVFKDGVAVLRPSELDDFDSPDELFDRIGG
ncbi:MAG: helix-turn-helix domain-containing protein [Candidatus Altiarchaeota archaeon]|nr:helix-turn-helix domain-containing protein [Candidatus Altiarchaeota archaeon]